ncbi:PAS domain-containing sensor histidine kinase [Rubrolithibacter danxiaensis]|uniref:PAS domain-containing sensor histidine kinase n=1 Tax=Rubrolithibacter danxiaensis TaxID=3390805 RepID=UPI003BF8BFB9
MWKFNELPVYKKKSGYLEYGMPVILVLSATVIKFYAFAGLGSKIPYTLYLTAILLCAIYSGLRSAVLALILACIVSVIILFNPDLFLFIPHHSYSISVLIALTSIMLLLIAKAQLNSLKYIREKEEYFRFLAESVPDKVWTADINGKANYYNKEWFVFTGVNTTDELRNSIWTLIHPDDRGSVRKAYENNIHQGLSYEMELRLRDGNGVYRWHLSRTKPMRDNKGNIRLWIGTCTDTHDQKQVSEITARNEKYFRFLADNAPLFIWQTDCQGVVNYISNQWETYSGLKVEDSYGAGWRASIHPDDSGLQKQQYQQCLQTRSPYRAKFRLKRSDGEYRWFLSIGQPFFEDELGYLGTLTDITEQEMAQQHSASQLKKMDEFVSMASHELKTPLTSIKLYLQILGQKDDQQGFINKSIDQLKKLESLIAELLDVSKISAGKLIYNLTYFDFGAMLKESVEVMQHSTSSHIIEIKNAVSVTFQGDKYRLEQVMTNVLSNAIKYSPGSNSILVDSFIESDFIVVTVQDFGIGIEKENLDKIFDRFYRIDSTAMKYEGLGLGLYIVSEILTRHHGYFWMESEPGKGSVFYFKLPITSR